MARPSQRPAKAAPHPFRHTLPPDQSALKRDLMLSDLETVDSSEAAALWAQRIMAAKNSLTAADAARVEAAFHSKLSTLQDRQRRCGRSSIGLSRCRIETRAAKPSQRMRQRSIETPAEQRSGIDKSALAFPEPRRIRDKEHLQFVAIQPCLICGRSPCDPHHCALRKRERSAARPATSSPCRCAVATTGSSIAAATRRDGGRGQASIRCRPHACCG